MSQFGSMITRAMDEASIPVLVDLGYVEEKSARDRADALIKAGVSRRNLSIEGFSRLLVKLPPKKADAILARFPIVAGTTYFMTTHHWRGLSRGEKIARVPALSTAERQQGE